MSQFRFHYVFSGKPVRVKQISSKTNPNTLKLKVPNPCHMVKPVEPTIHKWQGKTYWFSQDHHQNQRNKSCKSGNCLTMWSCRTTPGNLIKKLNTSQNKVKKNKKIPYVCIRCGYEMTEMTVCHLKCFRCGAEHDCSDKGSFW